MDGSFLSQLTGSFAQPAAENPTVVMIEAAYRQLGLDWRYINCEVAVGDLADAVRGARAMGWRGFNCSLPHKVAVIEQLDGLGESAQIIGAVNTVVRRGGRLIGENTDGRGFVEALRSQRDPAGARAVLLGAGGAARAIAVELALAGIDHLRVVNRDVGRGQALATLINERTRARAEFVPWPHRYRIPDDFDLLINATSIGLYPDLGGCPDIDPDALESHMLVADVIPNPPCTALLKAAESRGCTVLDGLGMLVQQGHLAIRYWTGLEADTGVMRHALEQAFSRP